MHRYMYCPCLSPRHDACGCSAVVRADANRLPALACQVSAAAGARRKWGEGRDTSSWGREPGDGLISRNPAAESELLPVDTLLGDEPWEGQVRCSTPPASGTRRRLWRGCQGGVLGRSDGKLDPWVAHDARVIARQEGRQRIARQCWNAHRRTHLNVARGEVSVSTHTPAGHVPPAAVSRVRSVHRGVVTGVWAGVEARSQVAGGAAAARVQRPSVREATRETRGTGPRRPQLAAVPASPSHALLMGAAALLVGGAPPT